MKEEKRESQKLGGSKSNPQKTFIKFLIIQ